jgi:hypothetical protein
MKKSRSLACCLAIVAAGPVAAILLATGCSSPPAYQVSNLGADEAAIIVQPAKPPVTITSIDGAPVKSVPSGTEIRIEAGGHYLNVMVAEQPGEFSFQAEGGHIYVLFGRLSSGKADTWMIDQATGQSVGGEKPMVYPQ